MSYPEAEFNADWRPTDLSTLSPEKGTVSNDACRWPDILDRWAVQINLPPGQSSKRGGPQGEKPVPSHVLS